MWEFSSGRHLNYILSVLFAMVGVAGMIFVYLTMAKLVAALLSGNKDWDFYLTSAKLMAAGWLCRLLFHSISTTFSHKATFYVLSQIRKRLLDKLSRLPLGTVMDKPSGSLKATICERVDSMETAYAHVVPEFTANLFGSIATFVLIFATDWRMGLASLISIPIGLAALAKMEEGYEEDFGNCIKKTKILNDTTIEYINGIEVIKVFGKEKTSYQKFVKAARDGAYCFIDWMAKHTGSMAFAMVVFPATFLFMLPIGSLLCWGGIISADKLILSLILSLGAVTPLLTIMSYQDDLAQAVPLFGEIANILEEKDLERPDYTPSTLPKGNSICLKDVHFSYKEKEVLHGINMDIKAGTVNALVGPSGSGKSTIAKLIASLWDVDSGSIEIGGVDIRSLPLEIYNKYISYVSQDNYLFNQSVMENIRMGKPNATDNEVIAAAKKCGCHDFIKSLESGYDTVCGEAGGHLSGGERQRIAIARAMLKDAPIVILDEATSYTDPESEAVIQDSLAKLVKGKTLLVIAHRLSTIADADCIFVVNDGKIEACGTQEQLLKKCDLYKKMWKSHISAKDSDTASAKASSRTTKAASTKEKKGPSKTKEPKTKAPAAKKASAKNSKGGKK